MPTGQAPFDQYRVIGHKPEKKLLGIGTIGRKVFGTPNDRKIKSTAPTVAAINALEPEFEALSDDDIIAKTTELKGRLENGETLEDLLPEAFANVREAARRALGLRAFDVQLMGAISCTKAISRK